jgi:hypothetical protein
MSLLRLLTAGRCLVGLKNSTSRYHESKSRLLPKFGTGTNPFLTKSSSTDDEDLAAPEISAPAREKPMPASAAPAPAQTTSTASSELLNHEKGAPVKEGRIAGWISKFRARRFRRKAAKVTRVIPQASKSPVQGELSLDQVRVVRNDLSDADLEVVTAKAPADPDRADVRVEPLARIEPAGSASKKGEGRLSMVGKL